jgi:sulfoxide reductase heme-binding subunit YedZ
MQGIEMKQKETSPLLRILVHLLGVTPLVIILATALSGGLSVNPIQDIEQRLGRSALYLLVATLAVTPLTTLFGWHSLALHRRKLGLYAFMYFSLHFITFAVVDYGLNLQEIFRLTLEKPFILLGSLAGFILLLLAITSFDFFMRKMGKRWKKLHRLVYIASLAVIFHYALSQKGDIFSLQGNILKPLVWGMVVVLLLVLRLPWVRRKISSLRQSFLVKRSALKDSRL